MTKTDHCATLFFFVPNGEHVQHTGKQTDRARTCPFIVGFGLLGYTHTRESDVYTTLDYRSSSSHLPLSYPYSTTRRTPLHSTYIKQLHAGFIFRRLFLDNTPRNTYGSDEKD